MVLKIFNKIVATAQINYTQPEFMKDIKTLVLIKTYLNTLKVSLTKNTATDIIRIIFVIDLNYDDYTKNTSNDTFKEFISNDTFKEFISNILHTYIDMNIYYPPPTNKNKYDITSFNEAEKITKNKADILSIYLRINNTRDKK